MTLLLAFALLLLPKTGNALSMRAPAPFPERVGRAQVIIVGHYAILGLEGVRDSVAVERVLIDRRTSQARGKTPPRSVPYLPEQELRTGRNSFRISDSLETSRNPNFGAVARYLASLRPSLTFAGEHASRKVFVRP